MSRVFESLPPPVIDLERATTRLYTSLLAAFTALAPVMNAIYIDTFSSPWLLIVLSGLLLMHLLTCPRLLFGRECVLYAAFVLYLIVSLLWAPDPLLGRNSLMPAINFLLIMVLAGSLVAFHSLRSVLQGLLGGFLLGAAWYTYTKGFPLTYPADFSYNAIAAMYLFGLFATLAYGWVNRARLLTLSLAMIMMVHVAATTSIKTNLGIALGAGVAGMVYFNQALRGMRRNAFAIVLAVSVIAYGVASSGKVVERVQAGIDRVSIGVQVLNARDDVAGYGSYAKRQRWEREGLEGWATNPVFGHGAESFRAENGITSHSTPIDLLYNFGLVGLALFYAVFASLLWRLTGKADARSQSLRALILAGVVCQVFMSLSGTLYYQSFLALFVGTSTALLRRVSMQRNDRALPSEVAA